MVLNKPGEILEYESTIYTVGSWVQFNNTSNYAGLIGRIDEIRHKEMGLDNQEPKIYCSCLITDDIKFVDKVTVAPCKIQSLSKEPPCYIPERDTPYPLCIGNGKAGCECCVYFKNLTGESSCE